MVEGARGSKVCEDARHWLALCRIYAEQDPVPLARFAQAAKFDSAIANAKVSKHKTRRGRVFARRYPKDKEFKERAMLRRGTTISAGRL